MKPRIRKITTCALFSAIALTIFVIENQIPAPVPIPGVKLGLSNIITLVAMVLLGRKEAGAILLVRILMGAMFAGSPSTLLFSAAGGTLAYLVMCVTVGLFHEKQLWIVSALAAIAHNAGQLLTCVKYGASILLMALCMMSIASSSYNPFIYFRF